MQFDLHAEKSEAGWAQAIYEFMSSATKSAFMVVGWIMILAAISYLSEQSDHWTLRTTRFALHVMLVLYLCSYFALRFEIKIYRHYGGHRRLKLWTTFAVNSVIALSAYLGLRHFLDILIATLTELRA